MKVKEYIKLDGSNPYKKWFDKLNAQAAAKVTVARARLELGNLSRIKWLEVLENIELIGDLDIGYI